MSRPTRSFPPPADAAARYDAVLRRGHSLRRRQRLVQGAGAGGAMVALLLVVAFVTTGGSGNDTDDNQVVSDPTVTTATTVPPPPKMSVTVMANAGSVAVGIDDQAQPDLPEAQICAIVRVAPEGPPSAAVAAGRVCWNPATDGVVKTTESELGVTNGAEIGCAANVTKPDPDAPTTSVPDTKLADHDFKFTMPAGLPAGDYVAEVIGVSGVGDGCPPAGDGPTEGEIENVGFGKAAFELP